MTVEQLAQSLAGPIGGVFGLLLCVIAYQKEWIVPGPVYKRTCNRLSELERRNEELEKRAWEAVNGIAGPAIRAVEKQIDRG